MNDHPISTFKKWPPPKKQRYTPENSHVGNPKIFSSPVDDYDFPNFILGWFSGSANVTFGPAGRGVLWWGQRYGSDGTTAFCLGYEELQKAHDGPMNHPKCHRKYPPWNKASMWKPLKIGPNCPQTGNVHHLSVPLIFRGKLASFVSKGISSSKPPFWGSMFVFGGVHVFHYSWLNKKRFPSNFCFLHLALLHWVSSKELGTGECHGSIDHFLIAFGGGCLLAAGSWVWLFVTIASGKIPHDKLKKNP